MRDELSAPFYNSAQEYKYKGGTLMKNDRLCLLYIVIGLFGLWLIFIGYLTLTILPLVVSARESIDPIFTLIGGLGIGAITTFFINIILLGWQFFFRKKGTNNA